MRFKKGNQVEVLSTKEVVLGCWRCAEIISGNGHTYSVRYGWFPKTTDPEVERVPKKVIRPCPPGKQDEDWVPGDLVEVFHNLSWKSATISKAMGGNKFLVRLHVLSDEFIVHKSHLRVRQCWKDDKWYIIGKGAVSCRKFAKAQDTQMLHVRTLKRGANAIGLNHNDAWSIAARKTRAIQKDGRRHRVSAGPPSQFPAMEDTSVSTQNLPHENYIHDSFNIGTLEYPNMDGGGRKPDSSNYDSLPDDTHSCASSVANCSAPDNGFHHLYNGMKHRSKVADNGSGDAESFCRRDYEDDEDSHPRCKKLIVKLYIPQLRAYHSWNRPIIC